MWEWDGVMHEKKKSEGDIASRMLSAFVFRKFEYSQ